MRRILEKSSSPSVASCTLLNIGLRLIPVGGGGDENRRNSVYCKYSTWYLPYLLVLNTRTYVRTCVISYFRILFLKTTIVVLFFSSLLYLFSKRKENHELIIFFMMMMML